tara:strand:- start:376 stop:795 length:420 start_codon:yes stop_codon:yes gene_type:complete
MSDHLVNEHRIKKEISNKRFGYQLASIILIIFLIRIYLFKNLYIIDYFLLSSVVLLTLISYLKSEYIIPIKIVWMKFAFYLAKILNPIILSIIYIVCFLPIGIIYKIIEKNNLKTKIDKNSKTYWEKPEDDNINFTEQF